ncbi:MAG: septum formation initiator family protein [Patescibacteria group bacterium]
MYRFEQRRDPMRLLWKRLGMVVLLVLVALGIRSVWGVYQKAQESRQLRIEAEARLDDLQQREAELRSDIAALKSDRGVEEELRERYDLAHEGEGVIVIVEPPAFVQESHPSAFQRFKGWFSW